MSPGWQRARAEEESEALNHLKLGQSSGQQQLGVSQQSTHGLQTVSTVTQ